MYKSVLTILVLLSLTACSQKNKAKVVKNNKQENATKTVTEFVPEHVRRSKIEVVKRY